MWSIKVLEPFSGLQKQGVGHKLRGEMRLILAISMAAELVPKTGMVKEFWVWNNHRKLVWTSFSIVKNSGSKCPINGMSIVVKTREWTMLGLGSRRTRGRSLSSSTMWEFPGKMNGRAYGSDKYLVELCVGPQRGGAWSFHPLLGNVSWESWILLGIARISHPLDQKWR